jgi:aminoglycoside phosphotransferase (APT) family kinase protein
MEFLSKRMGEYLASKLGANKPVEIADITRFGRGSSRETWFVKYHDPHKPGTIVSVVFRLDFPAGSTIPTSLEQEYFMYERLGRTRVPVAQAMWWEESPEWIAGGRPFYVREAIEGSWEVPHFHDPDPQYDELRIAISKEHLSKLALVHAVDWKGLGFEKYLPAPKDTADCAHFAIDAIMKRFEEIRLEPVPIMLEAAEWLHDNAPVAAKLSLCKGTNGLGEEIFRGREIVAMSDWEEATIGDPAADIAFLQSFVPELERDGRNVWGLEKALEFYRSVSGTEVTLENVKFYKYLQGLKMCQYSHNAGVAVARSPEAQIRQVWTGTEVFFVGKYNLASAMGWMEPMPVVLWAELNQSVEELRK